MSRELIEISDLIVSFDPQTLKREPVWRADVIKTLKARGLRQGAKVAQRIPVDREGRLVEAAVDRLLCEAHAEIQLLSEETLQGERVWRIIEPVILGLRARGLTTIHVVDVGCGIGYVSRWLAAHRPHADVRYVGVDFNPGLIRAAQRLAARDGLSERCEFRVANAFTMQQPAHIYTSTGVIHHFSEQALVDFFAAQLARPETEAWVHLDIQPSWLSPVGAWVFHHARFKVALGRHDGVCSAMRAHSAHTLMCAAMSARAHAPVHFEVGMLDRACGVMPIFRIMQAAVGARPETWRAWRACLGTRLVPGETIMQE